MYQPRDPREIEGGSEQDETLVPRPEPARWGWKRAAAGAAASAVLLLTGAAVESWRNGGSTTAAAHSRVSSSAAASFQDEVELAAATMTMKVRKPYDQCSTVGGDCTANHCCKTTNDYCWKTAAGGGKCGIKSPAGSPGQELEGTDTIVPVDAGSIGNSLFCFSVYRKNTGVHDADDQALDLLQTNHKFGEGIFACDSWRVFSDVDVSLGDYKAIKVSGDDFFQSKRPASGGWGAGQWINTPVFRKVWQKIYAEYPGGFFEKAWTVKADPDTVFLPERLRARLSAQPVPATGIYLEHCKEVSFGFFGSLEVISKIGAKILFENVEKCYTSELPWKTDQIATKYGWYGEDLFAQRCMDLHGVKKIWQFDLVTDGTCPLGRPWDHQKEKKWVPEPVRCSHRDTSVAFKPLKSPKDHFACLSAAKDGKRYDV